MRIPDRRRGARIDLRSTRCAIYHPATPPSDGGTAIDWPRPNGRDQLALRGAFWVCIRNAANSKMLSTKSTRVSPEGDPTATPAAR